MTNRSFNIKYRPSSNIKKNFNFNKERSILFIFILTIFCIAIKSVDNGNYSAIYLKVISNSPVPAPDQDEDENENHVGIHELPEEIKILHICDPRPKEIYINSVLSHDFDNNDDCEYLYSDFNQIENNVTFVWYEPLNNLESLFDGCTEITEIIFQNFDTSIVTNMQNMFSDCNSIISLDLSSFITDNVENMARMFYHCTELSYLTISNFDTSKVTNMEYMFSDCVSLTSLDLSNFITANVENMAGMFYYSSSLSYLNISNFDTSKVTNMESMFGYCQSLFSLNISNFNTVNVENMAKMFYYSSSLSSLNITIFDTSKVTNMEYMFSNCDSLTSLDLSNFSTVNVENMAHMFNYCTKLRYLDISNFGTSKVTTMEYMFNDCHSLISLDLSNFNTVNVTKMNQMFYACSTLKSLDLSKFDTNNVKRMNYMFFDCSLLTYLNISHFTLPERYIKQMFYGCQNLIRLHLPNIDTLKISPLFSLVSSNILVKINEIDYLYDDLFQCTPYLCCLDYYNYTLKDYHINNNIHKCLEMSNQDICTLCGNNYEEIEINKDKNYTYCVDKDEKYISIDATSPEINMETTQLIVNTTQLILDTTIVESTYFEMDTSELIINITQLIFNITENFEDFIANTDINTSEYSNNETESLINDYNTYLNLTDNIEVFNTITDINLSDTFTEKTDYLIDTLDKTYISNFIISDFNETNYYINISQIAVEQISNLISNINEADLLSGKDVTKVIESKNKNEKIIVTLTTPENQKNQENKNITTIDFKECETKVKEHYGINDTLYIIKIDKEIPGMKIPKIEYEIYYNNEKGELTKLDLSVIEGCAVDISIPVKIEEGDIEKYDTQSEYYNSICSKSTSESGTDITLSDRKNEFIDNNMTLCEEGCKLSGYNKTTEKVKCSCEIKVSLPLIDDITFDKNKLRDSIIDIKNIMNIEIVKCYKRVFEKNSLKKNYGLFIFSTITFLFLICMIKFYSTKNVVYMEISKIAITKLKIKSEDKKNKTTQIKDENDKKQNNDNKIKKTKTIKRRRKSKQFPPKKKHKRKSAFNLGTNYSLKKKEILNDSNTFANIMNQKKAKDANQITIGLDEIKNKEDDDADYKYILAYTPNELNDLDYKDALIYDKRTYMSFYFSLLRNGHLFFFSFFNNKDYNCPIIKKFLFFFSFAANITVNALFFNDSTMHQIYEDEGDFNFIYQIPQIIYSTLICFVIDFIIQLLSLSEGNVIDLKRETKKEKLISKKLLLIRNLKIKFALFFMVTFILIISFLYYIICFCGIYVNTQIHLIKDTIISFALAMITPFVIYLIPGIFRIIALKSKKGERECIYKISKLLQKF